MGLALLELGGCSAPTQITVSVTTDDCTGTNGTTVTVGELGSIEDKAPVASKPTCNQGPDGGTIGSLVIVPSGANDATVAVRVILGVGQDPSACVAPTYGPGCIVARRSLQYVPHQNVLLPILMSSACKGVACSENETCVEGACRSATVPDPATCTSGTGCGEGVLGPADAGGTTDAPIGDGGPPEAAPADTSTDSTMPTEAGPCAADGGCYQVPTGWTLAGFDPTNTGNCPVGFLAAVVVADPVVTGSSCTYGACSVEQPPTCGSVAVSAGSIVTGCFVSVQQLSGGSGCQGLLVGPPASAVDVAPAAASGGTCTVSASASAFPSNAQVCTNPNASVCDGATGICHQTFSPPLQACVKSAMPGVQTCPHGFPARHLVGTSASVTCPAAACSVTATCQGMATVFTGAGCTGTPLVVATNSCVGFTGTIQSIEYMGAASQVGCTTTPPLPVPSSADLSFVDEQTFCCTQ